MRIAKRKYLIRSLVVCAEIFIAVFYFGWDASEKKSLLVLCFILAQIFAVLASFILLFLRFSLSSKYKFSFNYQLAGTFHWFLAGTDLVLLLVNKSLTRYSLLLFFVMNFIPAAIILNDLYRTRPLHKNQTLE